MNSVNFAVEYCHQNTDESIDNSTLTLSNYLGVALNQNGEIKIFKNFYSNFMNSRDSQKLRDKELASLILEAIFTIWLSTFEIFSRISYVENATLIDKYAKETFS